MIRIRDIALAPDAGPDALRRAAARVLGVSPDAIQTARLVRRSIDARKKPNILLIYTVDVSADGEDALLKRRAGDARIGPAPSGDWEPALYDAHGMRPVVVGFGPAGMFAALVLALSGTRPIVLERGRDAAARAEAVRSFTQGGPLDPECNVQFGEGGAGAFSDGKLNTGIRDARIGWILRQFVRFGAHDDILFDAKPHVGTDVLQSVVVNLRREVERLGGQVLFGTKFVGFSTSNGALREVRAARADGDALRLPCGALILATGHSARDTFELLLAQGVAMAPKPFSMGVRIEHPQRLVDRAQYGDGVREKYGLPPADYKLNCRLPGGASAYTFCMCPGGRVIAAASEAGGVVTNGMSLYARDGENANSALLATLEPGDFPYPGPMGGALWQRDVERAAFEAAGRNYCAPAQRLGAFLGAGAGGDAVKPSYRPGVFWTDLHGVLPGKIASTLEGAIGQFDRRLSGFASEDAVLTAPETRSSSPVRLLRNDAFQCVTVPGLYPCGEGAGYAGGIVSAAADGMHAAEAALARFLEIEV